MAVNANEHHGMVYSVNYFSTTKITA